MKSKSSFAYIDSSGIVKCFSCDERLVRVYQDGKGKMPDVCPRCGCTLNYKPLGLNLNAGQMRYEKQTMNEPLILEPEKQDWQEIGEQVEKYFGYDVIEFVEPDQWTPDFDYLVCCYGSCINFVNWL